MCVCVQRTCPSLFSVVLLLFAYMYSHRPYSSNDDHSVWRVVVVVTTRRRTKRASKFMNNVFVLLDFACARLIRSLSDFALRGAALDVFIWRIVQK